MYEFTHRIPHAPWQKPSRNEDDWFHRIELEEAARREHEKARARAAARDSEVLALRRNHCPSCGSELRPIHVHQGRADQCPSCLGVWMDHRLFRTLTHPSDGYLENVLTSVVLQYSMGGIEGSEEGPGRRVDARPV